MKEETKKIVGWCGVGAVLLGTGAIILTGFGTGSYIVGIVEVVVIAIGAIVAKKN